ncbi:MAG: hypothetical protein IPJ94_09660 [Chloroflexi bacterium]|nr:hypothetical protein [Chloroflexota bacterium]
MDIPSHPTMRDLYQLIATLSQQVENQGDEIRAVRDELSRQSGHQQDNIKANGQAIKRLDAELARLRVEVEGVKAWQMVHSFTCPFSGMSNRAAVRAQLQHMLHQAFNLDELAGLAMHFGITTDDLRGDTLAAQVQELVLHCERRGLVNRLLELCRNERPDMSWPLGYE